MPENAIAARIQYYKQCFQASFQTAEGHGVFDNQDLIPLAVYANHQSLDRQANDAILSQWLVDQDENYLVELSDFVLYPTPNASATADVCYQPTFCRNGFLQLQQRAELELAASLTELGIDQDELLANTPSYDSMIQLASESADVLVMTAPAALPDPVRLNTWLVRQAKKIKQPTCVPISVMALMPKQRRSTQVKQQFTELLEHLAQSQHNENSLLAQVLLKKTAVRRADYLRNPNISTPLPYLSEPQNKALQRADQYAISFIQGPPGTGKSYTLAALANRLAAQQKSVLITAQSDHALSVIKHKLIHDFHLDEDLIVHFGHGKRNAHFVRQIKKLSRLPRIEKSNIEQLGDQTDRAQQAIFQALSNLEASVTNIPSLTTEQLTSVSIGHRLSRLWMRFKRAESFHIIEQLDELNNAIQQLIALQADLTNATLIKRFQTSYRLHASAWGDISERVGKQTVTQALQSFHQQQSGSFSLQSGLGVWLVNLNDIPDNVSGHFHTVIVDEATQVNMATALPALSMAENLVVAGDPQQLRHVSFLAAEQEKRIAQALQLTEHDVVSYRNISFLDYIDQLLLQTGQPQAITLLDEHYRSVPSLMQFNSDQFYNGDIQVLTGLNQAARQQAQHLTWNYGNGTRTDKVNVAEAERLVEYLTECIESERNNAVKSSIGVLSFFRDQADYLKKQILQAIPLKDIKKHQIKIGTPFSFQGEERDHIFISCAIDHDTHHGTWTYLNRTDVFNVTTSRARLLQTLFLSCPVESMPPTSLLRQYHDFSLPASAIKTTRSAEPWLSDMAEMLKTEGFDVELHHDIANVAVDLLLTKGGQRVAVDLIGFPGDVGTAVHTHRYLTLSRVGIPLFPLSVTDWLFDKDACLTQLKRWVLQPSRLKANPQTKAKDAGSIDSETAPLAHPMTLVSEEHWRAICRFAEAEGLATLAGFRLTQTQTVLQQMNDLLAQLFEPSSHTYSRYQASVNAVLKSYIDNLNTLQLLYEQVWETSNRDHSYWEALIAPIRERHREIVAALNAMRKSMQIEVAKPKRDDRILLDDLETLTARLKQYD